MIENFWLNAAYSVTPTILIGLVFWFVMRSILGADRKEREEYSKIEELELSRRKGKAPQSNKSHGIEQ